MIRYWGALVDLSTADRSALVERASAVSGTWEAVREVTAGISDRVRRAGDAALYAMAREYDRVELDRLEVPMAECRRALAALDPALRSALERAAGNIATVHSAFAPTAVEVESEPGVLVGRRPEPLARVGVYAPGGRACYPSSVLMGAVPARVAGVGEVVLCSPPGADGGVSAPVLAAAALAGVDRVFAVGGAGAVFAMAYGTASVPRVGRIVGPGNAYVAAAKLVVGADVLVDSPAGPSELLIVADGSADPVVLCREMLAQAEHDPDAAVVAVTTDAGVADALVAELRRQVPGTARRDVIEAALRARGAVLTASTVAEACEFASEFAPEHLLLAVRAPEQMVDMVRNAGTVFLGESSSVAFGDYMTGANHVLPTWGFSRSWSGLSTMDFMRWTTYQRVTPSAAARMSNDTYLLATAEGLTAHAEAAVAWGETTCVPR